MPALSLSHVSFAWPDGRALFSDLTVALPDGLTALIGPNGVGKSTLLRLALGDLAPGSGRVDRTASVVYVPQDVTLARGGTVAHALGVAERIGALRAIEAGSVDPAHYDLLGEDWAVEERAASVLAGLGLPLELDRAIDRLSGGEAMLLAVGAALLTRPALLVLDEPTNNLDSAGRRAIAAELRRRDGATLVVSHDKALLSQVDRILELRERDDRTVEARWFGGALGEWEQAREVEDEAARRAVAAASSEVARQQRALVAHVEGAGRKRRAGEKAVAQRRVIGLMADAKRHQAERTDARVRGIHQERLAGARERLAGARAAIARDRSIRIDLPDTAVPDRRLILEASGLTIRTGAVLDAIVRGPERIHLDGRNGAGKTTLIDALLRATPQGATATVGGAVAGDVRVHVPVGVLRQRLDTLDPGASAVANARRVSPDASLQEIRDRLGRFRLRGSTAEAPVATLSGGERFRAALACVLTTSPAPQLLVLDEPTNNLDLDAQAQLVEALAAYRGALLMVSHDQAFVEAVSPTRVWTIDGAGPVRDAETG